MKTFSVIAILLFVALVCLSEELEKIPNELVEGNNKFALELYSKLSAGEGNLFLSPYSISSALAMTYAGARGETEKQMAKTLHFGIEQKQLHSAFAAMAKQISGAKKKPYELTVANALWGQTGYKFQKEFLEIMRTNYGAGFFDVNFKKDAAKIVKQINLWVEDKTKNKIKNIVSEDVITSDTRLVLANAIYFKGAWESEFSKSDTKKMPFTFFDGKKADVPMMNQIEEFSYGENETCQILQLPYKGYDIVMNIILPKTADGIKELEKSIDVEAFSKMLGLLEHRDVILTLPKFKMETFFELNKPLEDMGMKDAFSMSDADFSGITGSKDLFISLVLHKAYVDVDEKGTEAAAATVVVAGETAAAPDERGPVVFKADHPFMFVIRERQSGTILFIGRVMDPR